MKQQTENELQAVTRRVLAKALREDTFDPDGLESADPAEILRLRPMIKSAYEEWQKEHRIFAIRDDSFLWRPSVSLNNSEKDPFVEVRWGFNGQDVESPPQLRIDAAYAFDFAIDILELFADDNHPATHEMNEAVAQAKFESFKDEDEGSIGLGLVLMHSIGGEVSTTAGFVRKYDRVQSTGEYDKLFPRLNKYFDEIEKFGEAYLRALGLDERGGYSHFEVEDWVCSGTPSPIVCHDYEEFPEDHLSVCSVCGYVLHEGELNPSQTCSGAPLTPEHVTYEKSIHHFDPRRSPALRESHRLNLLIDAMKNACASDDELKPFVRAHDIELAKLTLSEKSRYDKERIGCG